jgi:hypothetical protein
MLDNRKLRRPGAVAASALAAAAALALAGGLPLAGPAGGGGKGPTNHAALDGQPVERPTEAGTPDLDLPDTPQLVPAAGPPGSTAARLANNRVDATGLRAQGYPCPLPRFQSSVPGQRAFYEAELTCLNRAWKPVVEAAHVPFRPPRVELVEHPVTTPCGPRAPDRTALYCKGVLYMTAAYYRDVEGHGDDASVYFGQMAHEYGHHVQQLTGIMNASWQDRSRNAPRSPAAFENTRRLELQATCFGGMFLGSLQDHHAVDPALVGGALADYGERGDDQGQPPEHGTPRTNGAWARQGFQHDQTYQCNTWLAPPSAIR